MSVEGHPETPKINLSKDLLPLGSPPQDADHRMGDRRQRFWNTLVTFVNKAGYTPPEDRPTEILDIGCGKCEEGKVLIPYFGGQKFGNSNENVRLTGIDIDSQAIEAARDEHKIMSPHSAAEYVQPTNIQFVAGDATHLAEYPEIPETADVILIRHQQISDNQQLWSQIFDQALRRLGEEGIMILTSYSDYEHQMLRSALEQKGCEIVVDEQNPYASQFKENSSISIDRRIMIVRKIAQKGIINSQRLLLDKFSKS